MSIELTWLGHGGWSVKVDRYTVLLDPFFGENPVGTLSAG